MEITNYDRFNELETPALVLNSDGSVAYRNKVAAPDSGWLPEHAESDSVLLSVFQRGISRRA